jgi:microcystin degradation protein MlrC
VRQRAAPRVGILGCFHETNTFARKATDRAAFARRRGWLRGAELFDVFADTRTVVGGMLAGAADHGLKTTPVFGAYATPAGIVTASTFDRIVEEIVTGLQRAGSLDGLLVELHGAMVVEGDCDPETRLLRSVRDVVGNIPTVVVLDLHANMTPGRVELVDALVGYRTNPHVDTFERGADAASHLHRLLTGQLRTVVRHRRVPVLAAPIAQRSAQPPLRDLLTTARELEQRNGFVDVTVHGGYAFADVPHAGMSFTITSRSDSEAAADQALDVLAAQAWEAREQFAVELPSAGAAVREARELARHGSSPVAIADTGDNINGGGPGDTTWLLHAALAERSGRIAATLWDPDAVAAAFAAGVGGTFRAELGGKAETLSGSPVRGDATVRWLGDGTFTNRGPMSRGARVSMGQAAVVSLDDAADVILQSLPVQPNDPEMFRHVGLDPGRYTLVLLKGAAALRAGWEPLVRSFVDAGTRGVTDCDLARMPYRRLVDVWPLDPPQMSTKAEP